MEKPMNTAKIPDTDSIRELADFWDTHDLTDFEDQLEEVTQPVFERKSEVKVRLEPKQIRAVNKLAKSKGIGATDLIREWILEKIQRS